MDRFWPVIYLIGWFGSLFLASYLINWLLIRGLLRHYYRLFVAPGVIVHELSHALGCLVTGAQITEINFWKASGGHVKYRHPDTPLFHLFGNPIIALAPIWGTFLIVALTTYFLAPNLIRLNQYYDWTIPANYWQVLDLADWRSWLYLYLVTSLMATMAPSKTDMSYALFSLIIFGLLLAVIVAWPPTANQLETILQLLSPLMIFSLVILALAIGVAFILALPYRHRRFTPRNQLE